MSTTFYVGSDSAIKKDVYKDPIISVNAKQFKNYKTNHFKPNQQWIKENI